MTHYSIRQAYLAALLTLTRNILATLQVAFPINSQLPPVAYISQPFEFTFSPTTFTGGTPSTTYTLSRPPRWLALDSTARKLSGTPTTADIGAPEFELVAADVNGQVTTSVTLVVLEEQTIHSDTKSLLSQLATGGPAISPATLLLHSRQTFTFSLTPGLFQGVSTSTSFYAVSSDGSPLPSWLQFDSDNFRFSGNTPPLLTPDPRQQIFSFVLVASNVIGFSEANVQFYISISDHVLAFKSSGETTISKGATLQIPSLLNNITLDGNMVDRAQIASVNTTAPSWLHFNDQDLSFGGIVPLDAVDTVLSVTISSQGSNVANTTIRLNIDHGQNPPRASLGSVTALSGSYLFYQVRTPSTFGRNTTVAATANNLPNWLSFVSTNLTLQGQIPALIQPETLNLSFTFSDQSSTINASLVLTITQATPSSTSGTSVDRPYTTPTSTGSSSMSADNGPTSISGRKLVTVVLATTLPVLAVGFLACSALTLVRRRKKRRIEIFAQHNPGYFSPHSPSEAESQVGRPPFGSGPTHASSVISRPSNIVPQIELSWAPNSHKRTRNRLAKRPKTTHDSIVGSSWDDLIDFDVQSKDNLQPPPFTIFSNSEHSKTNVAAQPFVLRSSRKRPRVPSNQTSYKQSPKFRITKSASQGRAQVIGLPKRLSGAGHGAGSLLPTTYEPRLSWQTTLGTIPMIDSRPSTVVLTSFPAPPSHGDTSDMAGISETSQKRQARPQPTLRLVESNSDGSNSFQAARQQYYTQRARDQLEGTARFSNAGSRMSSLPILTSRSGTFTRQHQYTVDEGTQGKAEVTRPYGLTPMSQKSQVTPRRGTALSHEHQTRHPFNRFSGLKRDVSAASSHQFDSAISSDSQWEDENLVADRNTAGDVYWHAEGKSPNDKLSPRLPFESYREPDNVLSEHTAETASRRPRLADHRKHVDVEFERSQRSHKGSLRFV